MAETNDSSFIYGTFNHFNQIYMDYTVQSVYVLIVMFQFSCASIPITKYMNQLLNWVKLWMNAATLQKAKIQN